MRSLLSKWFQFAFLVFLPLASFAATKPIALVYAGYGACDLCVYGAADMAFRAGLDVVFVDEASIDYSLFREAKVWIQPGGHSVEQAVSMGPILMQHVRNFVNNGGGYVGFCAGSFISTPKIGDSKVDGFGFIPTYYHHPDDSQAWQIEQIEIPEEGKRWVYFAGGPKFEITDADIKFVGAKVMARALNGDIEELYSHYGRGRIAVSGFHPEANELWKSGKLFFLLGKKRAFKALLETTVYGPVALWDSSPYFAIDPDGSDYDIAIKMIQFAAFGTIQHQ